MGDPNEQSWQSSSSQTYLEIKDKARMLERLYGDN